MMPFAMFGLPGGPEVIVVGFIAVLLFGNRLPSVMRSLGRSVTEFKKGVSGIEEDIEHAANEEPKDGTKRTPTSPTA